MHEPTATTDANTKDFYSPEEVADILEVNKKTVFRWIENGELSHVRYGKTIRIPASALDPKRGETS